MVMRFGRDAEITNQEWHHTLGDGAAAEHQHSLGQQSSFSVLQHQFGKLGFDGGDTIGGHRLCQS